LERKNKASVFWSHVIAKATSQWHGNYSSKSIVVDRNKVEFVLKKLVSIDENRELMIEKFKPSIWYYEDMLTFSEPWFRPSSTIIKQNREVIEVANRDQILEWIGQFQHMYIQSINFA
jgi:hypothetical protein